MTAVKMKQTRSPIVSIEVRKVDPRESEARNMIMWLKTLPIKAVHDQLTYRLVLGPMGDNRQAVGRLKQLCLHTLDVTVPGGTLDFMRVTYDAGTNRYQTLYLEYIYPSFDEAGNPEGDCYSALCTQEFEHVVDAFKCFQFRIESEFPFKPAKV